ncbi:transglycosylase domain-containing protein [Actinomycetes bacterium KLBMP 9759]
MPPQRPAPDGRQGQVPPQRRRPQHPDVRHSDSPYQSSEMPLLTHDEMAAAAMARESARTSVALEERPSAPGDQRAARGKKPMTRGRLIRRWLLIALAFFLLAPIVAFFIGWFMFKVPTPEEAALTQVATFNYSDGSTFATVRGVDAEGNKVNRVSVPIDKVPDHVKKAVLAAEDNSFYSNPGFDITGIMRAVYNQLTGGQGGGSTITQQYIKVSTGQDDSSLWRKYKEVVLAVKISREYTKDQILESYLNTIYLGRGANGIQAAAQAYFGKDVDQLTVSEGAMLAGTIQSPSRWDPVKSLPDSQRRWNQVLNWMVDSKWLTPTERAQQQFPKYLEKAPPGGGVPEDSSYHIYSAAKAELEKAGITDAELNTQGLKVTTTIDPAAQKAAVAAVEKVMKGQPENLREALVSIDPRTGAILAYYGGENGLGLNYATAKRQPGSSFKPFVFAAALESPKGIGLGSTFNGMSGQMFPGRTKPVNNSGDSSDCGEQCDVMTAMTQSVNTVFYQMAFDIGPDNVVDIAHKAGIGEDLITERPNNAGIALGDKEVRVVDMASAYATFANNGERFPPYIVSKVEAADGRVLMEKKSPQGEQVIPADVARNVTESMKNVAAYSRIDLGDGRPVASKTGTVQGSGVNENKDAWMVGYTPQVSTAVWVGTDKSDPIRTKDGQPVYGRTLPGPIWQQYMNSVLRGQPQDDFSPFVPLGPQPYYDGDGGDGDGDGEGDGEYGGDNGGDNGRDNGRGGDNGGRGGDNNGDNNGNDGGATFRSEDRTPSTGGAAPPTSGAAILASTSNPNPAARRAPNPPPPSTRSGPAAVPTG